MATVYYKIVDLQQYLADVETQLNTLGNDGWELSTIFNEQAILISGSSGITVSGSVVLPAGVVSSSAQVKTYLPSGTVSSSIQVLNYNIFATTGSNTFVGNQIVSGAVFFEGGSSITGNAANLELFADPTGEIILQQGLEFLKVSSQKVMATNIDAISVTGSFSGSLIGTSSWASNAISSSYALSSSYAVTASHVPTAYGQWYSTQIQTTTANTASFMSYDSQSFARGFTYSGSRIYALQDGVYNLQFSAQFRNTANTNINIDVWLKQDGNDVDDSNTLYEIDKQPSARGTTVAALNYMLQMNSGSYAELAWNSNASTAQLYYTGSGVNPTRPAVPSVITTITQVG